MRRLTVDRRAASSPIGAAACQLASVPRGQATRSNNRRCAQPPVNRYAAFGHPVYRGEVGPVSWIPPTGTPISHPRKSPCLTLQALGARCCSSEHCAPGSAEPAGMGAGQPGPMIFLSCFVLSRRSCLMPSIFGAPAQSELPRVRTELRHRRVAGAWGGRRTRGSSKPASGQFSRAPCS